MSSLFVKSERRVKALLLSKSEGNISGEKILKAPCPLAIIASNERGFDGLSSMKLMMPRPSRGH
jgi:hypothetical protein